MAKEISQKKSDVSALYFEFQDRDHHVYILAKNSDCDKTENGNAMETADNRGFRKDHRT